jgi:hypothetical protein
MYLEEEVIRFVMTPANIRSKPIPIMKTVILSPFLLSISFINSMRNIALINPIKPEKEKRVDLGGGL